MLLKNIFFSVPCLSFEVTLREIIMIELLLFYTFSQSMFVMQIQDKG